MKRLPSKSVGLGDILAFVLMFVLKFIFNSSPSQQQFPALWKEAAIFPVFKKDSRASVTNYKPVSILYNFIKLLELIIHEHLSYYFKSKLNICQHGFYQIQIYFYKFRYVF